MSVALLVVDDGREDYLERCTESARRSLPVEQMSFVLVRDPEHELGFAGAIAQGWEMVLQSGADWVFHLESDFLCAAPVPIDRMVALLERHPELVQVALKRQAWNAEERAAGGIVELHPDDFDERHESADMWTEHRRFWTTNPSLYSAKWCRTGWPQEPQSEGVFTHRLLRDPLLRFAFWGGKFDPPLVEHIGLERAGAGY